MSQSYIPHSGEIPLIPVATLVCHRNQEVVLHTVNTRNIEEYKVRGDSSQTQSHSVIPGGKITI